MHSNSVRHLMSTHSSICEVVSWLLGRTGRKAARLMVAEVLVNAIEMYVKGSAELQTAQMDGIVLCCRLYSLYPLWFIYGPTY